VLVVFALCSSDAFKACPAVDEERLVSWKLWSQVSRPSSVDLRRNDDRPSGCQTQNCCCHTRGILTNLFEPRLKTPQGNKDDHRVNDSEIRNDGEDVNGELLVRLQVLHIHPTWPALVVQSTVETLAVPQHWTESSGLNQRHDSWCESGSIA